MKVIALLSFALLIGAHHAQEFQCPVDEENNCVDRIYPSSDECSGFYRCQFCQNIKDTCRFGVFDPLQGDCVNADDTWCNVNKTVFSVGNYFDTTGYEAPVLMYQILVNYGFDYSTASGLYTAPQAGLYFLHLSAGAEPASPLLISIGGLPIQAGVVINGTSHESIIASRSAIAELKQNDAAGLVLEADSVFDDDNTLWAGFRIDDFMEAPVVAFHAGNVDGFTSAQSIIPFDNITTDTNNAFSEDGAFTAPEDGVYVFAFSTGVGSTGVRAQFVVDEAETISELLDAGPSSEFDIETVGKVIVYELLQGQNVTVQLIEGGAISSPYEGGQLLSFSGFRFRSELVLDAYIWSLHSTQNRSGPVDYVEFDVVDVDYGNNYASNRVYITVNGYYFISASIASDQVTTNATVIRESVLGVEDVILDLLETRATSGDVHMVSRSTLRYFQDGDQLRMSLYGSTIAYSDVDKQTSFSGFLVERFNAPPKAP